MRRLFLFLLCAAAMLLPIVAATPRTAKAVQQEKQETAKKIERTRRQIKDNLAETKRELAKLNSLRGEMKVYRGKSERLRREVEALGAQRKALDDSIAMNIRHIDAIKASYAKALIAIRAQRHTPDIAYILSSESMAQASSRTRYLRELSAWQKEKAAALRAATDELGTQKEKLEGVQAQLITSIDSLKAVENGLVVQKNKADALVGSLKRQGKNLNKVLAEQERKAKNLDRELNRIIEEEARKAKEEKENKSKDSKAKTKVETDKLSGSFAANKGKLPLPVDREARIVSEFGRHTHAEYSKVEIENNGIDLESAVGSQARAVFAGTVSMIIVMEGYENVVLIRHGDYLTVYAGIDGLKVRKGQEVAAGQALGSIAQDAASGKAKLHFEVRHEKEKLDPSQWLRQ